MSVDPIDIGLEHFSLSKVKVGGRDIAVRFDRTSGVQLSVDGRRT